MLNEISPNPEPNTGKNDFAMAAGLGLFRKSLAIRIA